MATNVQDYINTVDTESIRDHIYTDYNEYTGRYEDPESRTVQDFLKWELQADASYLLHNLVIPCSEASLTFDGKNTHVTVYFDDESNIPTWEIYIGNLTKRFLSEDSCNEELDKLTHLDSISEYDITEYTWDYAPIKKVYWVVPDREALTMKEYANKYGEHFNNDSPKSVMCPTTDNWAGNFEGDYVQVTMGVSDERLQLYTLYMCGTDDCSMSLDVIGEEEAHRVWVEALTCKDLRIHTFKDAYFSN